MTFEIEDDDIETELRNLILRAFASGTDVEGSWSIETAPSEIPDWEISVTEKGSASGPTVGLASDTTPADPTRDIVDPAND